MNRLTQNERLDEIASEVNLGWSNSDGSWLFDVDDMKFLLNQAYEAKRLREALEEMERVRSGIYSKDAEIMKKIARIALEASK